MRVLLDECRPAALRASVTSLGPDCETVHRVGFGSKKNGALLSLAEGRWDVLLTPTESERPENLYPGAMSENEAHEGLVAPYSGMREGSAIDSGWPISRV